MLHSKIHKCNNSDWNKAELPQQWKESVIAPLHKKGDKTGSSNNRISLPVTCKILTSIFL